MFATYFCASRYNILNDRGDGMSAQSDNEMGGDQEDPKIAFDPKNNSSNQEPTIRPASPNMARRQSVFEDISHGVPRAMTRLNFL